jgi:hypothetical protein
MINDVWIPEVAGFGANRAHPPERSSEFLASNIFLVFVVVKGKTRGLDRLRRRDTRGQTASQQVRADDVSLVHTSLHGASLSFIM